MPASQLPSQTQEDQELASGAASLAIDDTPIAAPRLATFRTALGQLLNTPLFEDDSAGLDAVIGAVNQKVGNRSGGAFGREEAVKALKKLEEANHIMYVILQPNHHHHYQLLIFLSRFADGELVYKI